MTCALFFCHERLLVLRLQESFDFMDIIILKIHDSGRFSHMQTSLGASLTDSYFLSYDLGREARGLDRQG